MTLRTASSYVENLQRHADDFYEESGKESATTKEIAAWAIQSGRWSPPADLIMRKCREDFSLATQAPHRFQPFVDHVLRESFVNLGRAGKQGDRARCLRRSGIGKGG